MSIISEFSHSIIYSEHGVSEGRMFHGKCGVCNSCHYHGYKLSKNSNEIEFISNTSEYICFNTGIVFTKNFMEHANIIITIGGISFEKTSQILTKSYQLTPPLNPDRLENAWFLYRMMEFKERLPWPRKERSKELHMEELCKLIYPDVKMSYNSRWLP